MRKVFRPRVSPSLVVACIAIVLALTGSAFAAKALITGSDIRNGSITRADLSRSTINSLKGRRGPAGKDGQDGFAGPAGPQGSTGPEGARGPTGPAGPAGPKGNTGDTGVRGPQGVAGNDGRDGATGPPGQTNAGNWATSGRDLGTALALNSTGPADPNTDGVDLSDGGFFLSPGQYLVHVAISATDANAADPRLEYAVGRLFLDASPLDGVTADPSNGSADGDTTLVTPDIPDDGNNAAQAAASFLVTVGDNGGGGEQLTLRGAVRSDEADGATGGGRLIITRIG